MNRRACEYQLVRGPKEFVETEVEKLTQSNWVLHGGHQVCPFNGVLLFSQALIKEYEQPGAWG